MKSKGIKYELNGVSIAIVLAQEKEQSEDWCFHYAEPLYGVSVIERLPNMLQSYPCLRC